MVLHVKNMQKWFHIEVYNFFAIMEILCYSIDYSKEKQF